MPPLAQAVRLIHRDEPDLPPLERAAQARRVDLLRREVDDRVVAPLQAAQVLGALRGREGGVDQDGGEDPLLVQRLHLVAHEGNEGREDERDPRRHLLGEQDGGELEAE